jgi:hypothetical protein
MEGLADEAEYRQAKPKLLKEGFFEGKEYLYSLGQATARSSTELSATLAEEKAQVRAEEGFYEYVAKQVTWPEDFSRQLKSSIFEEFKRVSDIEFAISKCEVLERGFVGGNKSSPFVALKLSKNNLRAKELSYLKLVNKIKDAFLKNDARLDASIFLEICPLEQLDDVIEKLISKLEKTNRNLGHTLRRTKTRIIGRNRIEEITLNSEIFRESNVNELQNMLAEAPSDPSLCFAIGEIFKRLGFSRNADLYFLAGTYWPIPGESRSKCRNSIESKFFKSRLSPELKSNASLSDKRRKAFAETKLKLSPLAKLVIQANGQLPVLESNLDSSRYQKALAHYGASPPDLNRTISTLLIVIEVGFSADSCNLIGRCIEESGHDPVLAEPFYQQAVNLNQEHPYAGANLAASLFNCGEKKLASQVAKEARLNPKLSDWGKNRLTELGL